MDKWPCRLQAYQPGVVVSDKWYRGRGFGSFNCVMSRALFSSLHKSFLTDGLYPGVFICAHCILSLTETVTVIIVRIQASEVLETAAHDVVMWHGWHHRRLNWMFVKSPGNRFEERWWLPSQTFDIVRRLFWLMLMAFSGGEVDYFLPEAKNAGMWCLLKKRHSRHMGCYWSDR